MIALLPLSGKKFLGPWTNVKGIKKYRCSVGSKNIQVDDM